MPTQEQVTLVLTNEEAWQVRCAINDARVAFHHSDEEEGKLLASAAEKLDAAAGGFKA